MNALDLNQCGMGAVAHTFSAIEICEREIAWAKRRNPTMAKRIDRAFGVCCPTPELRGKVEAVYAAHVHEQIARVMAGFDTRLVTDAEILCTLSHVSLNAPLRYDYAVIFEALFNKVMYRKPVKLDDDRQRLYRELRGRCVDPERTIS